MINTTPTFDTNERDRNLSDRNLSAAAEPTPMPAESPYCRTVLVHFPVGLHVRPAMLIAQEARKYQADVFLVLADQRVSARNVFEMLALGAEKGTHLTLEAGEGSDGHEAVDRLAALFASEHAELFAAPSDS